MSLPLIGPQHAVFLDIDGTLIDLAATPDAVVVPAELPGLVRRVAARTEGALAILSGRKMADIDRLLGPGLLAAAEHGAIMRGADGVVTQNVQRPAGYDHWRQVLGRYAQIMPGMIVEEKQFSLVLHYRQCQEHEAELRALVEQLLKGADDAVLLLAHCAFEMKPRGGDKGDALAAFMERAPFAGRVPVFVGDDVTDEPAISEAARRGGSGLHVKRDFGGSTQAVRDWLAGVLAYGSAPP